MGKGMEISRRAFLEFTARAVLSSLAPRQLLEVKRQRTNELHTGVVDWNEQFSGIRPEFTTDPTANYYRPTSQAVIGFATHYGNEAIGWQTLKQTAEVIKHQMEVSQWVNVGYLTPNIPNYSGFG